MSRIRKEVQLYPPDSLQPMRKAEMLVSPRHICPYCHGNGFFYERDDTNEVVKEPCPVCEGSGMLDAYVTVKWKPTKTTD